MARTGQFGGECEPLEDEIEQVWVLEPCVSLLSFRLDNLIILIELEVVKLSQILRKDVQEVNIGFELDDQIRFDFGKKFEKVIKLLYKILGEVMPEVQYNGDLGVNLGDSVINFGHMLVIRIFGQNLKQQHNVSKELIHGGYKVLDIILGPQGEEEVRLRLIIILKSDLQSAQQGVLLSRLHLQFDHGLPFLHGGIRAGRLVPEFNVGQLGLSFTKKGKKNKCKRNPKYFGLLIFTFRLRQGLLRPQHSFL